MPEKVRVALIGVGHLGRHHARLLSEIPDVELVAICDADGDRAKEAADQYGARAASDYRELGDGIDAVSVVVPTTLHREVAGHFLERGTDVLVEKPITPTLAEGLELVDMARSRDLILQVGHVERFNPALRSIEKQGIVPRYIESHRLAPFTFRSMDIGAVLDLMIHDLDLVLGLIDDEIESVEAFGGSVFTNSEDMASAILKFRGGAVAHLTANRVALKPMRKMRIFSQEGYVSLDFHGGRGTVIRKNPGVDYSKLDLASVDTSRIDDLWKYVFEGLLSVEEHELDTGNPLKDELEAFVRSVQTRKDPVVNGEAGCAAVGAAQRVLAVISENRW